MSEATLSLGLQGRFRLELIRDQPGYTYGMIFGLHPFAVWLEIFLRLTRLYLAPTLP